MCNGSTSHFDCESPSSNLGKTTNKFGSVNFIQYICKPNKETLNNKFEIGKSYLVPCLVKHDLIETIEWVSEKPIKLYHKKAEVIPVLLPLHSDVENGQLKSHYHADMRFVPNERKDNSVFINGLYNRPYIDEFEKLGFKLVNVMLEMISNDFGPTTPSSFISKSVFKKCIKNGKCPHRGFDLSAIEPVDGVITCPLHGLRFDKDTKKII